MDNTKLSCGVHERSNETKMSRRERERAWLRDKETKSSEN